MLRRLLLPALGLALALGAAACSDPPAQEDDFIWDEPDADGQPDGDDTPNNDGNNAPNNDGNNDPGCTCEPGFHCDGGNSCVPDSECDDQRACPEPLICRDGVCQPECNIDADCGEGLRCRGSMCVEPQCASDMDCADPVGESCVEGFCEANPCRIKTFTLAANGQNHQSVHVAGTFNEWPETIAGGGLAMTYLAGRDLWFAKEEFDDGRHLYKFVIDEGAQWIADPTNPNSEDDGFNGQNSVLEVACGAGGVCGDLEAFDWRDAVMYFIMVDRFNDSDGQADRVNGASEGDALRGPSAQYVGGDLDGVTEKMEYLRDLGVTALWLSAPYNNREGAGAAIDPNADNHLYSGYHGYWPSPPNVSFANPDNPQPRPQVESRIGDEDGLRRLIDTAHSSESANGDGIKVLFDYVMNHVDVDSGLYRAHNDWFARRDGRFALCGPENLWDDAFWGTRCAFTDYLPPFDFENDQARRWSVDDAIWWAKEFNLDGYRLDAIKHVPLRWLIDLRARLQQEFSEPAGGRFYLVGETFAYDDAGLIRRYVNPDTMLDGQFDFPMKARLCEALFTEGGRMDNFSGWMDQNDTFYGPGAVMTTWIGNHDIPRAIHFASRQIGNCREGSHAGNGWTNQYQQPGDAAPYERLGLSYVVMMTNPGIPLIYYGDEIGLAGGGDPDNRRMMPWEPGAINQHQEALRERISKLAHIRANHKVLARGRRTTLQADADTWVYRMSGCGAEAGEVIVAINRTDGSRTVSIPAGSYTDLMTDAPSSGGSINLGARGFVVLGAQ